MEQQKTKYGTPFLESEALLAASESDDGYVHEVLSEMSAVEVQRLMASASHLAALCRLRLRSGA